MGDLFKEKPVAMTSEQRLLKAIFGDGEQAWLKRENEAAEFMSAYIEKHSDYLEDAVIKVSDLRDHVRIQMEHLRREHIAENRKYEGTEEGEENDFAFAKQILILGTLRWLIESFEEKEGDCFIHLCDKGCEAVRSIMKKRKERH